MLKGDQIAQPTYSRLDNTDEMGLSPSAEGYEPIQQLDEHVALSSVSHKYGTDSPSAAASLPSDRPTSASTHTSHTGTHSPTSPTSPTSLRVDPDDDTPPVRLSFATETIEVTRRTACRLVAALPDTL